MRKLLIAVSNWQQNDAIGTDVTAIGAQLTAAGWQIFVHTAVHDPAFASYVTKDISGLVSDPHAVLFYVNGFVWEEGEALIRAFAGRRIMRFHAGPLPHFFRPYGQDYYKMVERYWAQTRRVVPLFDFFLPVSEFAASTLSKLEADRERIRVVSVFNRVDELAATVPDPWLVQALRKESRKKVLTVARVTAQKGQRHILEVACRYKRQYGDRVRFYLVGPSEPDGYYAELNELVRGLDLGDVVEFVGGVDRPKLRAYYEAADVFLCLSESESFCVPLIEAQHFRVPIIAHACMAIPETLGDGGVLVPNLDYAAIAATVDRVIADTDLRGELIGRGLENVQRFSRERTTERLIAALESSMDMVPSRSLLWQRAWRDILLRQRERLSRACSAVIRMARPW